MKNIIARLRELALHAKRNPSGPSAQEIVDALPQLLDRMEKLEVVAEAAQKVIDRGEYYEGDTLMDALAALEDK